MTDSPLRKLVPIQAWNGLIADAATIAELDRATIEDIGLPGAVLMERAAEACVSRALVRECPSRRVVILVGPGNNGGDGSAIARILRERSWRPTIVLAADETRLRGDAKRNFQIAKRVGIPIVHADDDEAVCDVLRDAPIWIDALLGVGNEEAPRGTIAKILELAHRVESSENSKVWTLAVDLPTGLRTSSGGSPGLVLRADETVALGAPKPAHYLPGGLRECGTTYVADIGVLDRQAATGSTAFAKARFKRSAVQRDPDSYKGSSGHVLILAGSKSMPGAAALCATAALRAGAGLVSLASDESVRTLTIQREPSVIGVPIERIEELEGDGLSEFLSPYSSFLIGPGFGFSPARAEVLRKLLPALDGRPCIVDADGLTVLSQSSQPVESSGPLTLTPHPGELARLLSVSTRAVLEDIPKSTLECSQQYGAVVCTKAAGAWISDGEQTEAVYGGVPILGAAGSGDVLSGIMATFAYSYAPIETCARAAFLHVAAGRELAKLRPGGFATAIEIANAITPALVVLKRDDA